MYPKDATECVLRELEKNSMYFLLSIKYFQLYDGKYCILWSAVGKEANIVSYIEYRNKTIEASQVKNEK